VPVLDQVIEKYPQDVKIVFKNYPIRGHNFAEKAAIAALAADKQGKFWPFHDQLFNSYNQLSDQKINEIASKVGLDMAAFEKDRSDPALKAIIQKDVADANQAGVRGTPTVFVNGRMLRDRRFEGFQAAVDKELERLKGAATGK
jgi:protein-disulfide isomerase